MLDGSGYMRLLYLPFECIELLSRKFPQGSGAMRVLQLKDYNLLMSIPLPGFDGGPWRAV